MARPRSENKRSAILAAAAQVFAEQGLAAPTARIARQAGVADGTLFTYFASKDELLNQLYVELKTELREVMMADFPASADLARRAHHIWERYVDWGARHPHKRKAIAQLAVSEKISAEHRAKVAAGFVAIDAMQQEGARNRLADLSPMFVGALMGAVADTTIDFMAREPEHAKRYREAGFQVFWNGLTGG